MVNNNMDAIINMDSSDSVDITGICDEEMGIKRSTGDSLSPDKDAKAAKGDMSALNISTNTSPRSQTKHTGKGDTYNIPNRPFVIMSNFQMRYRNDNVLYQAVSKLGRRTKILNVKKLRNGNLGLELESEGEKHKLLTNHFQTLDIIHVFK